MERAVEQALRAIDLDQADGAAVQLARVYAQAIDADPDDVKRVGPLLLAVLESLGMTPRSRSALVKGGRDVGTSPLDELRQRRAARIDGAEAADAPAS